MDRAMTSRRKEIDMTESFIREYLEELYKLGYRYLTTDDFGDDCVFKSEPEKCDDIWNDEACSGRCLSFSLGLSSWDDTEPKSIAEILGVAEVDWFKVPVDTKILVSDNYINWIKGHFAKYEGGKVHTWNQGCTSWTTRVEVCWIYAKLAEE